jgi:hypothetical protein
VRAAHCRALRRPRQEKTGSDEQPTEDAGVDAIFDGVAADDSPTVSAEAAPVELAPRLSMAVRRVRAFILIDSVPLVASSNVVVPSRQLFFV